MLRRRESPAQGVAVDGRIHPAFAPVAEELGRQIAAAGRGGASVCVYHRGEPVVDIWAGARDEAGAPWERDTLAMSFSTTKGVVSTLAHILADRGELDLAAPVAAYWPEFAQAGKDQITVSDLLTHRAGLHRLPAAVAHAEHMSDWGTMIAALAAAPAYPLGDRSGYHALTFGWLLGEVIRRVTKLSVGEAIARYISEPLGGGDMFIGAPAAERHRLADLLPQSRRRPAPASGTAPKRSRWRVQRHVKRAAFRGMLALLRIDPDTLSGALSPPGIRDLIESPGVHDVEIPAMNGVFSARALARMYAMIAGGGELDGVRLLSPEAVARAGAVQVRGADAVLGFRMRWRLGYHLVGTTRGTLPDAFGHFGFGGSGAWADPTRNLSFAMTLNRVAGTPVGDLRMMRISATTVACADRRR